MGQAKGIRWELTIIATGKVVACIRAKTIDEAESLGAADLGLPQDSLIAARAPTTQRSRGRFARSFRAVSS